MFVGHRSEQFKKHEHSDLVGVCCNVSIPTINNKKQIVIICSRGKAKL